MAKVDYIKPIEALHGKIQKSDTLGFARKTKENKDGEKVKYTVCYGTRSTPYTNAERMRQARFGAIAAATNARIANEQTYTADRQAFMAQSTYSTFREYIWHLEAEAYDNDDE